MVSVRTLGSHRLISLSRKKQLRAGKMDSGSDADFEVTALALFCFICLEDLVCIREKENIGYKQGIFVLLLKLHHPRCYTYLLSQLLLFRVLPFVTRIRFLTEIRKAGDAALA